jgi:parvulin-like peptidyl-prolyl cis-trans isomerase-like protein
MPQTLPPFSLLSPVQKTMKRIFKEPLLHFLLLGVAIFAVYRVISKPGDLKPETIVVTRAQITAIADGFTRTWRRPPMPEELEGLIRDRVQEEVYCREAIALGLDKDDMIIRRRLRQKMEFVTDGVAKVAEPTENELGEYLQAHADTFRVQRQFTFSHVFLDPQKHGEALAQDTAQLLAQLKRAGSKADVSALGDPFLLDHSFVALPSGEATKQFGEKFAAKLGELSLGQWQGPIESGYGLHLVLVTERTEGRLPALTEVREAVKREWTNSRRLQENDKFYAALLKHYVVTIEAPPDKRIAGAKVK